MTDPTTERDVMLARMAAATRLYPRESARAHLRPAMARMTQTTEQRALLRMLDEGRAEIDRLRWALVLLGRRGTSTSAGTTARPSPGATTRCVVSRGRVIAATTKSTPPSSPS